MASFQNLKAWQHAKTLAVACLKAAETLPQSLQGRGGLADQLRRAAASAALNIAEGVNRGTNKDLRQFLVIAMTSLDEVAAILEILLDAGYLTSETYAELERLRAEAARTLFGFLRAVNQRIDAGEAARTRRPGSKPAS